METTNTHQHVSNEEIINVHSWVAYFFLSFLLKAGVLLIL